MLKVECEEHIQTVKTFASKTGQRKQLEEKLLYLETYADEDKEGLTRCCLYFDSAPYSFGFSMERKTKDGDYKPWFNGGLIYHGSHDNGGDGGAPTYSVNIEPMNGWSVHT